MKPWHASARVLPVTVRPVGGETVISYARRLAEANELAPTAVMRALGQLSRPSGYHLLNHDAWLSDQALGRLEAYSGISRDRLTRALPALRHRPPHTSARYTAAGPFLHIYRPWPPARPACRRCTLRASSTPGQDALVRPVAFPLVCRRHKRWLDQATQYDLSPAGEILTAHQRYAQIKAASTDREWFTLTFRTAWQVTQRWADAGPRYFPVLGERWRARTASLSIPPQAALPPIVTFPEAVTLTEILTDLNWRRHVAMVSWLDLAKFYRYVAWRMGEPSYPRLPARRDQLQAWVSQHRGRFAATRKEIWARAIWRGARPFPEIRHFK